MPAQLKMWSMRPYLLIMESMKELTEAVEETSNAEVRWTFWGVQRACVLTREWMLMSCRQSVPPREDSLMAVARPIPDPAPVMRMILFSKEGAMINLIRYHMEVSWRRWGFVMVDGAVGKSNGAILFKVSWYSI